MYIYIHMQDYPSIGQIAEKLFEFDIIPIFAVVGGIQDIYNVIALKVIVLCNNRTHIHLPM